MDLGNRHGVLSFATQIVDLYHARERLADLGKIVYGPTREKARPWTAARKDQLDDGDVEAVVTSMERLRPRQHKVREEVRKAIDYFQTKPLGIAALEDKIVQHAVGTVLNQIWEEDFLGFSYGFRPGRGQQDALDALWVGIVRQRVNWILDLDIRSFFDKLQHEWLVRFVEHRMGDKRVVRLIQKWLQAGVMEQGQWTETKEGSPQGAVISPILANLYLHYVLDLWVEQWRRKQARREACATPTTPCWGSSNEQKRSGSWSSCGSGWRSSGWNCTRRRRA